MPSVVRPLDQSQLYAYCETCAANGNPRSPLRREMDTVKCPFGHTTTGHGSMTTTPFSGDLPDTARMSMVKLSDIQPETPGQSDIMWKIPVHPRVKELIESRYAGRWMITVSTTLAALADGSVVMITGPQAAELKKLGVNNGADILSAIKQSKETEKQLAVMTEQQEKWARVVAAAGVTTG